MSRHPNLYYPKVSVVWQQVLIPASIADIPWKSFFADLTLQKLIDSAIVKNYDMQIAIKNIEASQLLVRQSRWNNVPQAGPGRNG